MKRQVNPLLEEYQMQTDSLLTSREKNQVLSYAFYDVYDVTIGGWDNDACTGCCCFEQVCKALGARHYTCRQRYG